VRSAVARRRATNNRLLLAGQRISDVRYGNFRPGTVMTDQTVTTVEKLGRMSVSDQPAYIQTGWRWKRRKAIGEINVAFNDQMSRNLNPPAAYVFS